MQKEETNSLGFSLNNQIEKFMVSKKLDKTVSMN